MNDNIKKLENDIKYVQIGRKGEALLNKRNGTKLPPLSEDIAIYLDGLGYRKQSETVKEFAQKAISRVFEGITQRFCDCYNDGLLMGYPDSELSWNFFRAFDECKDIAEKEINDLAEQFGKEE
ncbi:hypothetical protein EOM82_07695 [bacterium]|nr:hypothetical protein [bacterium]